MDVAAPPRASLARALALAVGLWAQDGHTAGGQFGVDDAAILDAGMCQIETWGERADHAGSLLHAGAACRVGAVELGLNADRIDPRDGGPITPIGPQIKWAVGVDDRLSVGLVALAAWQGSTPRYAGATLYAPLTWRAAEVLLLNVNIGWDWVRGVPSRGRAGISLEWQASAEWTVIVERYGQYGAEVARAGLRWQPSDVLAVDLSRARGLGSRSGGSWTLGATWTFDAPGAGRRAR